MIIRVARCLLLLAVVPLCSCIPGSDRGEAVSYTGDGSELPLEDGVSDWFLYNKIVRLIYEPLPSRSTDGFLPRTIGKYTLLSAAPTEGKEYRDNQRIFYIEEITKNRRMRIFSRDGTIFRLQAFTRLTDLETDRPEMLLQLIKDEYGPPDLEHESEITYVDKMTVLLFSISEDFLVSDLMDVTMTQLPDHIEALLGGHADLP